PGCRRPRGIVRKTEINKIDLLARGFRDKTVVLGAREIDESLIRPGRVGRSGVAGHDIGVNVNRVNGIDHGNTILMTEDIENVAAIAFGSVGDENLIVLNIHAPLPVFVCGDDLTEKLVALLRTVAPERVPAREF